MVLAPRERRLLRALPVFGYEQIALRGAASGRAHVLQRERRRVGEHREPRGGAGVPAVQCTRAASALQLDALHVRSAAPKARRRWRRLGVMVLVHVPDAGRGGGRGGRLVAVRRVQVPELVNASAESGARDGVEAAERPAAEETGARVFGLQRLEFATRVTRRRRERTLEGAARRGRRKHILRRGESRVTAKEDCGGGRTRGRAGSD